MPNRILREGIIGSLRMAALVESAGWIGEVFYRRLMSKVDDFGIFVADPTLVRAELFPRQLEMVREADASRLLAACEKSGLIRLYALNGATYLEMLDFRQQMRAKRSKYPLPPNAAIASAAQVISACVADDTRLRTKTETESKAHSETKAGSTSLPTAEEIDTRLKSFIQAHPSLPPWNAKMHAELYGIATKGSWEEMERCVSIAIAEGAGEPGSYARGVFGRSQAKPKPPAEKKLKVLTIPEAQNVST